MAITDADSVLVLGAGVSAPFGLSLGVEMVTHVSDSIKKEINNLYEQDDFGGRALSQKLNSAANTIVGFSRFPIHGTVARNHWGESSRTIDREAMNASLDSIIQLEQLLNGQTSETLDDFIIENPSYAYLTKVGIAALFMRSCYKFEGGESEIQPFSARHYPPHSEKTFRNWVHLLINIVRQGIRAELVTEGNKIKIITFNYDNILEYILEEQFSNTEASYPHCSNYIEIIHVHGECGALIHLRDNQLSQTCLDWANGIHVVNETDVPEDVAAKRKAAKKWIKSAKELFFCGFSFSGPNCRLSELESPIPGFGERVISFCNYDGNVGISKTVKNYGTPPIGLSFTTVEEAAGSPSQPLGVSDWIKLGYLGELPG